MRKFPETYIDGFMIGQLALAHGIGWLPTAYAVAKWLECHPPTAQRHIRRLVEKGYLTYEPHPDHKRGALVAEPTEAGMDFLKRNVMMHNAYQWFLMKHFASEKGYQTFVVT